MKLGKIVKIQVSSLSWKLPGEKNVLAGSGMLGWSCNVLLTIVLVGDGFSQGVVVGGNDFGQHIL